MKKTNELIAAKNFLQRRFPNGGRVLCAVSGGMDSMCLLHFAYDLPGFETAAAHFNHQLRGPAADRDEVFVKSWCSGQRIPLFTGTGDTRALMEAEGLSAEEAGRKLRYEFLQKIRDREEFDAILTAHHADDNAETILLHLVRGTGLKGLCGIPQERDGILRPFLEIPRKELADYAAAHEIPHVEDETNTDPQAAARNLIRLQVMPLLRQVNSRSVEHMSRTASTLREIEEGLSDVTERYLHRVFAQPGRVTIRLGDLAEVPQCLRPQVLLGLFDLLGVGRRDIGAVHLEALGRLWNSHGKDARISLPHGVTARLAASRLILETLPPPISRAELVKGCPLRWGDYTLTLLDHPEGEGLMLRSGPEWETVAVAPCPAGERLTLAGSSGSRSIKRLCLDRHIGIAERDRLPAIYIGERLAAVWQLGVDQEFAPAGTACRFIQIIKETEEKRV